MCIEMMVSSETATARRDPHDEEIHRILLDAFNRHKSVVCIDALLVDRQCNDRRSVLALLNHLVASNDECETLILRNSGFTDEECAIFISEGLSLNESIKTLDISMNAISKKTLPTLGAMLQRHPSLRAIHANYSKPDSVSARRRGWNIFCDSKDILLTTLSFNSSYIGDEEVAAIGRLVFWSKILQNLNLGQCMIQDTGLHHLCAGIRENSSLITLILDRSLRSGGDLSILLDAVSLHPKMEELSICDCHNLGYPSQEADDEGFTTLSLASTNMRLKKLNLSSRMGEGPALGQFVRGMASNRTILDLNLSGCVLGNQAEGLVGRALQRNRTLRRLNLKNTETTDLSPIALALAEGSPLEELELGGNWIMDAECLAESLLSNATLRYLGLGGTRLKSSSVASLASMLQANSTLTGLDLSDMAPFCLSITTILDALRRNNGLRKLDLSGIHLRNDSDQDRVLSSLCKALESNTKLQKLNMAQTYIGTGSHEQLGSAIGLNDTLRELEISFLRCCPNNVLRGLASAFESNHSLTTLRLCCDIEASGAVALAKAVKACDHNLHTVVFDSIVPGSVVDDEWQCRPRDPSLPVSVVRGSDCERRRIFMSAMTNWIDALKSKRHLTLKCATWTCFDESTRAKHFWNFMNGNKFWELLQSSTLDSMWPMLLSSLWTKRTIESVGFPLGFDLIYQVIRNKPDLVHRNR